jgi:glycosyltransferase involved in cell wall biosynthesis
MMNQRLQAGGFFGKRTSVTETPTIVFIQKSAGRGGAKSRLLDTLGALKHGADCRLLVVCSEKGEFTRHCSDIGVPVLLHGLPEWRKLKGRLTFGSAMRSLAARLAGQDVRWVVSNEMWWAPHAAALASKIGARSATILRDGIADAVKGRKYRLHRCDLILPLSRQIERGLEEDPGLKSRSRLFHDGLILPPQKPESAALLDAAMHQVNPQVRRWLLVIGRVQPRKRQEDAVRTLKALMELGHQDLGLLVAGDCDADYEPVMRSAGQECGVTDRVVMLGNFSDIRSLFARADACLLTSLREALPGSVIESFLSGKPCFMYPCEGAEDIFGPHQEQFVSTAFDPRMLADKMDRLLRKPDVLAAETSALQARARSLFSIDAHLRSLAGLLGIGLKTPTTSTEP